MASSSLGAIPVINEKGENRMERVKVERYICGKKPKYAPSSSDEDLYEETEATTDNEDGNIVIYDQPPVLPDDKECDDPRLAKLKKPSAKQIVSHSIRHRSTSYMTTHDEESSYNPTQSDYDDDDDSTADVRPRHAMARGRKKIVAARSFMERFEALTTNQLKLILLSTSTDENIDELVDSLPEQLERERCILLETVRIQAENNINRRPDLERIKLELSNKVEDSNKIRRSIHKKESALMNIIPNVLDCQDSMPAILLAAAAEAEEYSENIAHSFLCREFGSYDTFLKLYLEKRKLAHMRRMKAEKFLEQP